MMVYLSVSLNEIDSSLQRLLVENQNLAKTEPESFLLLGIKQPSVTLCQKGFRQNRKQFTACINLDKKLKDQSRALHSHFFAILHHKSTEWKTYVF